jgi:hypothetical protein
MELYINDTKLVEGDIVESFRGDKWIYKGHIIPEHPGSSGRIVVAPLDKSTSSLDLMSFYPGVFNAKWQ